MTHSQITKRFLRLTRRIGTYSVVPEQTDVDDLLDMAMGRIAQECKFYDPAITFTMTADVADYRLDSSAFSRRIFTPKRVRMDGSNLRAPSGREGLWTIREFELKYPDFMDAGTGTPTVAVWNGNYIKLFNTPSSSYAGTVTGYVAGEYIPGWIEGSNYYNTAGDATTTSQPDLPVEFHSLVADLAAHLGSTAVADSDQAWGIVRARQARVASQIERLRAKNRLSNSAVPLRGTIVRTLEL